MPISIIEVFVPVIFYFLHCNDFDFIGVEYETDYFDPPKWLTSFGLLSPQQLPRIKSGIIIQFFHHIIKLIG